MADTIWGTSPLSEATQAYKQAVDVSQYAKEKQSEADILSAKAQEAKIGATEELTQYKALLAERAGQTSFLAKNPDAEVASITGRMSMYSKLLEAPETKNNPVLMRHVQSEMDQLRMTQAQVAKTDMEQRQNEIGYVSEVVHTAVLDPSSPGSQEAFSSVIQNPNVRPEIKNMVAGLQQIFRPGSQIPVPRQYWGGDQPKTYEQLPPALQEKFKNDVDIHFTTTKDGLAAASKMNKIVIDQQNADTKAKREDERVRNDSARIQADRERTAVMQRRTEALLQKQRAQEEKLRDKSPQLAKAIEERDKALRSIEKEQLKILTANNISNPEEKIKSWYGKDSFALSEGDREAYARLEKQKEGALFSFEEKNKVLLKADQLQPKMDSVTVKGTTFTRPSAMSDEQWKAYKKAVGAE